MIVITNKGEYAKVNKVMSNHYEICFFNGKVSLIERSRCSELVPASDNVKATEKLMKLATERNELIQQLKKELKDLQGYNTPHAEGWKQCAVKVINFLTINFK